MHRVGCALVLALLAAIAAAPASTSCGVHAHERVVLFGAGDDPSVLLWDSRFRLRAYHLASFDESQAMLPRALLVAGGTRAIVLSCIGNFVQPRYGLTLDDALYVKILTGPLHGRSGWVIAADARLMR